MHNNLFLTAARTFIEVRYGPHDAGSPHRGFREREGQPVQGKDVVLRPSLRTNES